MGYTRERNGRGGKSRFTAYYLDIRDQEKSAGSFATRKQADAAWQDAEAKVREGRGIAPPRKGALKFEPYVRQQWFPHHRLEVRSRETYHYYLEKHIIGWFGPIRMIDIRHQDVREFVAELEKKKVKPSSIEYCLKILSAIFTTALNDQVIWLHPCKGVTGPVVATKIRQIITPEQFDVLHEALGTEKWQLLVELDIETGLRWGELTELRPKDFAPVNGTITVSRVAIEVTAKFNPEGTGRFLVKEYPKDREHRQVTISRDLYKKVTTYTERWRIGNDDLLFAMSPRDTVTPALKQVPDPSTLGRTEPNAAGKTYQHGTISGYSGGGCHCEHCRAAYAVYRRDRRAQGKDRSSRGLRVIDADGHVSRRWFRDNVWLPARKAAGLPDGVKAHSLRHAHASWLLAGGTDIARVKERLGHSTILTTQKYLHTLPDEENDPALDALSRVRNRQKQAGEQRGRTA